MPEGEAYSEWTEFYIEFFPNEEEAKRFVVSCEDKEPPRHPSRLIMHQCKRLISAARDIISAQPSYHSLQVFLMLVCAEAVAKLHEGTRPRRQSQDFVLRFFTDHLPVKQQQLLVEGFRKLDDSELSLEEVVDALYQIRCDVAHEGQYGSVFFSDDGVQTASGGWPLWTSLTLKMMYEIIVSGCIAAACSRLDDVLEVPRPSHNKPEQSDGASHSRQ